MPTRERKKKEAEKKAYAEELREMIVPEYIQEALNSGELATVLVNSHPYQPDEIERLRGGLREVDETGENWVESPTIGKGSREKHTLEKAKILKRRHQSIWKQRSAAKRIAHLEEQAGRKISVRTVQRCIKLLP